MTVVYNQTILEWVHSEPLPNRNFKKKVINRKESDYIYDSYSCRTKKIGVKIKKFTEPLPHDYSWSFIKDDKRTYRQTLFKLHKSPK